MINFRRNPNAKLSEGDVAFVIAVNERRVLLPDNHPVAIHVNASLLNDGVVIGEIDGTTVVAIDCSVETSDQIETSGWLSLRELMAVGSAALVEASILAIQRLEFRESNRFCSRCGLLMEALSDTGVKCSGCGHATYPNVTPAVLVLIEDSQRRTLLAQKEGWGSRYSVIAGFVEPGESLEQCCIREALEEVGVTVSNVRYVGSQPWPFPHQLMVAFRVEWVSGDVVCDVSELKDARWFSVEEMPELPPPIALSRILIQHWIDNPTYP